MTPHAENFAAGGERSSQMLSSGCALQIQIDRFRSKTDIGLGELLDMPFERHEGLGQQHDVCNKVRIVANKLAVAVGDCLAWIARLVLRNRLSFAGWKWAPASCKSSVVGMPVSNASPAMSGPLKPSIAVLYAWAMR
jgi:hypothetical protein